jgi:amino acid permease
VTTFPNARSATNIPLFQFYTAIYPLDAESFFKSYLAIFVVLFFYAIGWIWKRSAWKTLAQIDVDSGRAACHLRQVAQVEENRQQVLLIC